MAEYIERGAAINAVRDWLGYKKLSADIASRGLETVPAADVAPVVHGRWLREEPSDPESDVICSNCQSMFDYIDGVCYLVVGHELPYYCPNCGAIMDLEDWKAENID